MSKRTELAIQISLSTWFVHSCRGVSRLDSTFSRPPNYLLYFVHNPLKHSIDASAIGTTLVFQVLVLLAFIEREKKMSDGDPSCIQRPCYSSRVICHV